MLFTKKTASVSFVSVFAGLMLASAASAADIDASLNGCVQMAKQVATAIDTAQPGKAKDDARAQQRFGREYCAVSMYEKGVAHYAKALKLLGQ